MSIIYPKAQYLKDVINVKDYGATGDGTTDDTAAIQAAMDASVSGGANAITPVVFPPGRYYITSTVTLPVVERPDVYSHSAVWMCSGYGATIYSDQNITFWDYTPDDASERDAVISYFSRVFEGLVFEGTNGSSQVGLEVEACYTLALRDCRFNQLNTGFIGKFCIATNLENCRARYCDTASFKLAAGSIGGSNSTKALVSNCRSYMTNGEGTAYDISAGHSVLLNCVSEGHYVKYHYDVSGSCILIACYCECDALYAVRCSISPRSVLTLRDFCANGGPYHFLDLSPTTIPGGGVLVDNLTTGSTIGSIQGAFGFVTYAGGTTYTEHQRVAYSGNVYRSRVSGNIGNQPDISPTEWEDEGADSIMRHTDADYSPGCNFTFRLYGSNSENNFDWLFDDANWDSSNLPVYLDVRGPRNANAGTAQFIRSIYTKDYSNAIAGGILDIADAGTNNITIAESGATSLDDIQFSGKVGGRLVVRLADGNVTVNDVSNGGNANFQLAGNANFTPSSARGALLEFIGDGNVWYEIARTDY